MKINSGFGIQILLVLYAFLACSSEDSGVIRKSVPVSEKDKVQTDKKTADNPAKDLNAEKDVAAGSGLFLSWTKSTAPVLSYRIYSTGGNDMSTGGELIRTIAVPSGQEATLEIELTNGEAAKATGGKLCLYMIATNSSFSSEPSTPACLVM